MHAIRNLARIGFGTVAMRWAQLGFGRTSSTSTQQATAAQPARLQGRHRQPQGRGGRGAREVRLGRARATTPKADWLAGGSYLVARRINMHIEPWDRTSLREQETLIGRDRQEGAPLSGGTEFTEPDFGLQGRDGPLIAMDAHVRLAHPKQNNGAKMLRRGYNFTDGSTTLGRLDAGLFFIAFVRDPDEQYIPMQTRLSRPGRPDGVPPAHRLGPVRRAARRAVEDRLHRRGAVRPDLRPRACRDQATVSNFIPAFCSRASRFSAIAVAVVT